MKRDGYVKTRHSNISALTNPLTEMHLYDTVLCKKG